MKQVPYDPNQVYEVVGNYGYQTMIQFGRGELVKVVALGDTIAWEPVVYKDRLFLKPVEKNATTNLTVITTQHTYYFHLTSTTDGSKATYLVRFRYPHDRDNGLIVAGQGTQTSATDSVSIRDENLNYGVSGDTRAIHLQHVFDDGRFTFFQFEPGTDVPEFWVVLPDGSEARANVHRDGKYFVVERVAQMFTLRRGNAVLCVSNEANPLVLPPVAAPTATQSGGQRGH